MTITLSPGEAIAAAVILLAAGWLLCVYVWGPVVDWWYRATSSAAYWAEKATKAIGAVVLVGGVGWLLWKLTAGRD